MNIEPKVKAATGGASAAAAVCWVLTQFVFHGVLPVPVEALVDIVVPGAVALLGGYLTPHQNRPGAPVSVPVSLSVSADPAQLAQQLVSARRQYDTLRAPTGPAATPDPAPLETVQPTENPNPKENPMSLADEFRAVVEQFRGDVLPKVAPEAVDEFHALVDLMKGQFGKVLAEAGHDAQADATTVAGDVAQLATDTAGAVAPADPAAPTA